jgi:hypothetical protein
LLAALAGCASDANIRRAIEDVNREFKEQYEQILATEGSREFRAPAAETFAAVQTALVRLNMRVESRDPELGYLTVAAPAPAPLNNEEWQQVAKADLPMMQRLALRHIGLPAYFISFEPEGLEIVINATVIAEGRRSEVSLTTRMRQVKPPPSGMPRRDYAPPTGVRIALEKIWAEIERELKVKGRPI